ncbi:MAG: hypothetical protein U1C19_10600 [Methanobacteriaceae archaeon]|nr:hypothetical protein [Methanobacteriaceae archaeon]
MTRSKPLLKKLRTLSQDNNKINISLNRNAKEYASVSRAYYAKHYLKLQMPDHQFNWLQQINKHRFSFLKSPRDHGKTTVIPRTHTEHTTLFNQNRNVLLLSKTYKQANKTLKLIHTDLKKNPFIQADFAKELIDLHKVDNQLFYNHSESLEDVKRDATVEAVGLLGDITGGHFTDILLDDIIDDENSRTHDSRENVWKWLNGTIIPLLEPGGHIFGTGTNKHYEDVYTKMEENTAWYVISEKAILQWPDSWDYVYHPETGVAIDVTNIKGPYKTLWPDKWGIKELLLQLNAMGSVLFNREYQNDAAGMKGKILKDFWLNWYAIQPERQTSNIHGCPPWESLEIYQGYDLAIGQKEKNDYFVATTIGVQKNPFRIYFLDWYREKLPFPKQVKMVYKLFDGPLTDIWQGRTWNPLQVGIESNAYQIALAQQVLDDSSLPVKEIMNVKNKVVRITAGAVNYENGLVYLPVDHPQTSNFLNEYTSFDDGKHDDILDSGDITMRILITSGPERADVFG